MNIPTNFYRITNKDVLYKNEHFFIPYIKASEIINNILANAQVHAEKSYIYKIVANKPLGSGNIDIGKMENAVTIGCSEKFQKHETSRFRWISDTEFSIMLILACHEKRHAIQDYIIHTKKNRDAYLFALQQP